MTIKKLIVGLAVVALLVGSAFGVAQKASALTAAEVDALAVALNLNASQKALLMAMVAPSTGMMTGSAPMAPLTLGSSGAQVTNLQNFLISNGFTIPAGATGYFGAQTQTALAAFQSAKGITPAAGYYGPITEASVAAMMAPAIPPATGNFPAGCTSSMGFSPTTGMSCVGGSTPGTSGPLSGGAGDVTVSERSSGVEDEILEGAEDVKVLGFEVEADGSDVAVTSVRVEFQHEGSGSDRLDRYVDEVSIWMGSEMVGSVDVGDFSEDSDDYSSNIALSNVVVREDDTERLYVAITASNNVDSDDLGQNWEVALGQVRFEDATGAILTDNTGTGVGASTAVGPISELFSFEDLSTSGDITLRVSEDDESVNEPHSVGVEDSSDTNDVDIFSFNLDAEGSDIFLNSLVIDVTSSSGTGVTEIANDFRLMMDGDEVGTVTIDVDCDGGSDGFASTSDEAICVVVSDLDDDDVVIGEDEEVSFMLVADINDVDAGFASGDKLSANLAAQLIAANEDGVDADDENGDALANTDLSGSADSSNIEFLSTGISVDTVSTNTSSNVMDANLATDDRGIFEIVFDVTAIEDDAFIGLGTATLGHSETDTGANYDIQEAASSYAATSTGTQVLADVTRVSGGTVSGNFIKVGAGQTARFKLTVTYDPILTGGYRMYLYSVNFAATAVNATGQQVLTPEVDYRTDSLAIGS